MSTPPAAEHAIRNVALLDLTGATSADMLDRVTRIENVAAILVPESLIGRLMAIPMSNVAATVPIPDGKRVKVMSGQVVISGEALSDPDSNPEDILVVAGQLVITSPVQRVGHQKIVALGQIIAPVGSETGLGAAISRLSGQTLFYPYSGAGAVRVLTGSMRVSGAELANPTGQPTDTLVCVGQLLVTSPIERLGYQHIVSIGQIVAPRASEAILAGRVTSLGVGPVLYSAPPRLFDGRDHFSAAFFDLLDEPITLILDGRFSFDEDVAPELLKRSVAEIILDGKIVAPRRLVPMLQFLAVQRDGKIVADDSPDDE